MTTPRAKTLDQRPEVPKTPAPVFGMRRLERDHLRPHDALEQAADRRLQPEPLEGALLSA